LVGLGSIGGFLVANWVERSAPGVALAGVCVRPRQVDEAKQLVPEGTVVCTDIAGLLALNPEIVIEAAGRETACAYSEIILSAGKELYLLSVGILADQEVRSRLTALAAKTGGNISIPAGALAGFDGLLALAKDGIRSVKYVSAKPIAAWQGTPAEAAFCLNSIEVPTIIFNGSAGEAARLYPKNANLAAAVALAGIGFERTEIELIADPSLNENVALLEAEGTLSRLSVRIQGIASAQNPKTSAIVGSSILSALQNSSAAIRFI